MNLEDDILIERFLRNELSEEERESFDKRVAEDEVFKGRYVFEKQLFESLNDKEWSFTKNNTQEVNEYIELFEDEETQKLKQVLQKTASDYKNKKKRNRVVSLYASIAAIALILITLNVFLNSSVNTNQLYNKNIELNQLSSFTVRGGEVMNLDLSKAENFFKEKKYQESLEIFDRAMLKEKDNSLLYIYKGIAHAELKQYKEGEIVLNQLINSDLIDAEKGYWYKSLLYIKSNQIEKAKAILHVIVEKSFYKKEQASVLLEKL